MTRACVRERYPADALVNALIGRTVVNATCDGEGMDDVRLLLDDGTAILIDRELDRSSIRAQAAVEARDVVSA